MLELHCSLNTVAWIYPVGFVANVIMAIILGRYRRRSMVIAWFQVATTWTALINLGYGLTGCTASPAVYNLGYMINQLALIGVTVTIFVYVLYLTNREEWLSSFWLLAALGAAPLTMLALAWGTDLLSIRGIEHAVDSGFGYQTFPNGPLGQLKGAYIGIGFITSMVLTIRYFRRIKLPRKRREIGMIVLAMAIPSCSGIIAEGILPNFGVKTLPLGAILVTLTQIIIIYSMLRYGIYIFNVRSATSNIVRALPSGLIVADHTDTIQFVNQGALRLFGYKESDLIGASVARLFPSKLAYAQYQALADTPRADGTIVVPDTTLRRKDAALLPVSINVASTRERGQLINTILVITDITALKQAEHALEVQKTHIEQKVVERTRQLNEAQAQLAASVGSLPFGFALINQDGEILFSNAALEKYTGRRIPPDPAASKEALQHINASYEGVINILQCVHRVETRKRSIERNVSIAASFFRFRFLPVIDRDTVIGTVWLIEDTTEAKALERSRDEFFSIASHELRTPLTAIRGNASMMLEYYPNNFADQGLRQMVDDIHESSSRLIMIVNDFLDVSRLELNKLVLKNERFDVTTLMRQVIREYDATSSQMKLALTLAPTTDALPPAYADINRTRQVLINLVGNAINHTKHGSVTLSASVEGKNLKITVSDTGEGIPASTQHLLFRKFQQASNNILTRNATKGTGLGLYISKLLAEAMGGKVYLVSTELGKGSTFCLEIPAHLDA